MTLKEILNERLSEAFANEIEQLTDEFDNDFMEWCFKNYNIVDCYDRGVLLSRYKKEKGL